MADTIRGNFTGSCSDCGSSECIIQHWGPLVPHGKYGKFCKRCWLARVRYAETGQKPRSLGYQKESIIELPPP